MSKTGEERKKKEKDIGNSTRRIFMLQLINRRRSCFLISTV